MTKYVCHTLCYMILTVTITHLLFYRHVLCISLTWFTYTTNLAFIANYEALQCVNASYLGPTWCSCQTVLNIPSLCHNIHSPARNLEQSCWLVLSSGLAPHTEDILGQQQTGHRSLECSTAACHRNHKHD